MRPDPPRKNAVLAIFDLKRLLSKNDIQNSVKLLKVYSKSSDCMRKSLDGIFEFQSGCLSMSAESQQHMAIKLANCHFEASNRKNEMIDILDSESQNFIDLSKVSPHTWMTVT